MIPKYYYDGVQERTAETVRLIGHTVKEFGTLESACLHSDFWVIANYLCDLIQSISFSIPHLPHL